MTDYKGKIYKIHSAHLNKCYIGSTKKPLAYRFEQHKMAFQKYVRDNTQWKSVFEVLLDSNATIELIEDYSCEDRKALCKREGHFIKTMTCCNKNIAGRSPAQWRIDNCERLREYRKRWAENNKERVQAYHRGYYEANKALIKNRSKNYYEANKERMRTKMRERYHTLKASA